MNDVHMLQSKHPIFQSLWSHWNALEFLSVDSLSSPQTAQELQTVPWAPVSQSAPFDSSVTARGYS